MITSNDEVTELKIDESVSPSSSSSTLLKAQQQHYHESSGYSSKEAECSSPENKTHLQHRHYETKLRITANNNNNNNNNSHRTADTQRRRHKLPTSSPTVSHSGSLTIDESLLEPNQIEQTAVTCDKSIHRLSPICDEHLFTNTSPNALSNNEHFPNLIPSDDPTCLSSLLTTDPTSITTVSRHSTKSPSHQATLFARRHFHVYDWTRLSFYDNVPPTLGYQSEPTFLDHRSMTGTSTSSTEEKNSKRSSLIHIRSSTDRKDSGLGASSVERQIDSLVSPNTTDPLHRSTTSISSSSSSPSSSSENDATTNNTIPSSSTATTTTTTTPSRLPTSRKIRVKWHSFTKSHRPSFNSSKYHLGQMSVGQLFALRRAASIRIQELFDTTRILSSSSNKEEQTATLVNSTAATPQSLLATAFSAVPKLIIRRHQQRKEGQHVIKDVKKSVFGVSLLAMTQRTGHPVPITIISAMKYLRRTSIDSVGIFRKPGVSHRIKRLHDLIESDLEFHQFDDFSPYDVSDVLKQYFRSLPECLFTTKLSPLFLNIAEHFAALANPSMDSTLIKLNNERRLRSLQYAVLLLPDENRLVLHLLLSFLNDVSKHSKTNQMSSINLATCFAPTLFSFHNYQNNLDVNDIPSTIRKNHQTILSPNIMGMPDWREIHEQRKAMEILSFLIDHVRLLFLVPDELHQACHFSYIEIGEPCTLEELARRVSETTTTINTTTTTPTAPILTKYRRCSSSHLVGKRTAQQRATEIGTISASDSIGSLSSSPSASSSCENMLLTEHLRSIPSPTSQQTVKSFSSSRLFNDDTNTSSYSLASSSASANTRTSSYQGFIDRCIVEVLRESCHNKLKGWTSFGINNDLELAFKKLDDGHPLGLWKASVEIEAPPIEILNRLLNERHSWDDDFQSGTIIEQLNENTHVHQYTLNSMAPLASRYFCEVRSWRTNIQLNTNGNYQTTNQTNNNSITLPVGSSSSASSSAIASFITTQNGSNQKRDACVLVCTSIEHPKAHCPPTLVRAVTLASRYLIQSYGCGKSKVTHLSRVDLMGRSNEWYTKAYGSILSRSMTKLRDSFAHYNTGPETKV